MTILLAVVAVLVVAGMVQRKRAPKSRITNPSTRWWRE